MEDIRQTGPVGLKGVNTKQNNTEEYVPKRFTSNLTNFSIPGILRSSNEPYELESSTGDLGKSRFDEDILSIEQLQDVNTMRGENQHWSLKWLAGFGKMGILTATTFTDNFLGTLAGLVNIAHQGINGNIDSGAEAMDAFVNNPVSRVLQEINNKAEEWMPNYKTTEEMNAPWWQRLGTANFWADGFLKNTGFFLGAYLSGVTTTGTLTKAMQLDKAKLAFKGITNSKGETLKTASEVLKAYKTGDAVMDGKILTDNLVSAAKNLKRKEIGVKIAAGISGSMGESRIEAISNTDESYNKLYEELESARERDLAGIDNELLHENPNWFTYVLPKEGGVPTQAQLTHPEGLKRKQQLKEAINAHYDEQAKILANEKIAASNKTFLWNLAVTSLDNMWQFGEAFTGGFKQSRKLAAVKRIADGTYAKSKRDVIGGVSDIFTSMLFEGGQEMAQKAIGKTSERWMGSKLNDYYGDALNPEALEAMDTYFGTLMKTTAQTLGDIEEYEDFVLGALTSLLPMPGGAAVTGISRALKAGAESQQNAEALNNIIKDENKRDWIFHLSRLFNAQKEQDVAIEENDRLTFKNAAMDKAISSVITYTENDKFQDLLDIIEDSYDVTEEDIDALKALTIDKTTGKSLYDGMTNEEILEQFKSNKAQTLENAKRIHDTYTAISILYGDKTSKEGINTLTYLTSSINDRENRIKQITKEVINDINTKIDEFQTAFGYSPVERLKDVHDLQIWFSEEDKKELLEWSLGKRSKDALKKADNASKKIDKKNHRYRVLQGKKGNASRIIKALEVKETEGTITEEESIKLKNARKKLKAADRQMPIIRQAIEDLKEFKKSETDKSQLQITEDIDKLSDLIYLLNEREILINDINELQEKPEKLDEALSKDVIDAYNSFIDRKQNKEYNIIKKAKNKKEAISKAYKKGIFSPEKLQKLAEDNNDTQLLEDIKTFNKLQSLDNRVKNLFANENNRIYTGDNPIIKAIVDDHKNEILGIINEAKDEKEAKDKINEYLDLEIGNPEPVQSKIASNIKIALEKQKENTTSASNKEKTTEKKTSQKSTESDVLLKLKNNPNRESVLNNMSEKDLKDLVIDTGLYNQMNIEPDEIDSFDKEGLISNILEELEYYEGEIAETEVENDEIEDEIEKDTTEETIEEETIKEEEDIITIDSDTAPISAPKKTVINKSSSSDSVFDSSMKIGNAEAKKEDAFSENTSPVLKENVDYWTVGQKSSKYEIKPLSDPNERKLVEREDNWEVKTLDKLGAYSFIDSGELSKLMLLAESVGKQLPITFVQLRNQGNDDKINGQAKNDLFLAVDWEVVEEINKLLPKDKIYKKPEGYFENTFFKTGIDKKSKMQLIGKFDYDKTSKSHKKLLDVVKKEIDTIGYINEKGNFIQTKFAASSVVTTLDWVFSGRLVKQKKGFDSIEQRDLIDIIPKEKDSENLINLDGEIQLAIITPRGETVVGEELNGEVIELNTNRLQSPVTHSDRRLATPWIKIREADGRVYYKAIRIKKFDSNYTDDNSPIAQRIKQALTNISKTTDDALIKNNLNILRNYLYIPAGKKLFVNLKTESLYRGDQSISLKSTPEELYEFIKAQGYIFTFGLDPKMSLMDTITSNIFTTDLAQLHNANASMVISKVVFNEDSDYSIQPHDDLVNRMLQEVHLGKKGFQAGRGFSAPVKIYGDDTTYVKSDNGTYYIEVDGHREEAKDLKPLQKALIDFMISLPTRTDGYWFGGKKGSANTIKILEHKIGNKLHYITDFGRILTDEEVKQFKIYIDKKLKKEKSSLRDKAEAYLNEHLKGVPNELPVLTEKDLLESKKEVIKSYMQNNSITEISNSELQKLFKLTRSQLKELKDSLTDDDVFGVTKDGLIIKTVEKTPKSPVKIVEEKKEDKRFRSRKKAARESGKKGNEGIKNVTTLSTEEIEEMANTVGNLIKKLPQPLQGLRTEILRLLPGKKSIDGFVEWLNTTLLNEKIKTDNIIKYYNQAFNEDFTVDSTIDNLLKEIKQTLNCG